MLIKSSLSPEDVVSAEKRLSFRSGLRKLLGINAVSFALSAFNETVVGHSALGFSQAGMELVDTSLAAGLNASEKQDAKGNIKKATKIRQGLYGLHIGVAGVGIAEAARLMSEGAEPSIHNIAISGIVGALNGNYLYHRVRHARNEAHTQTPNYDTAMNDPIEVIQDDIKGLPDIETVHKMNDNGTTAIAWTNVIESAGGIFGASLQMGYEQAGATAAIVSGAGVIAVMGKQIYHEQKLSRLMTSKAA
jgi:hypothetical protein